MHDAGPPHQPADMVRLARRVAGYVDATHALCALSASLTLRGHGLEAADPIERALADVVDTLGLQELMRTADRATLGALELVLRGRLIEAYELADDPTAEPGWRPSSREVIVGQALTADTLGPVFRRVLVPQLRGLAERLAAPGATFLDVRAGGFGLVVSLCREWPMLCAVGLDIWPPALVLGRERIAEAAMQRRIELRELDVLELEDQDAYDLSWLPADFVAEHALREALERVHDATRPGGWIAMRVRRRTDALTEALARLRTARIGGTVLSLVEAERLLADAGWTEVRSLTVDEVVPLGLAVGRRPT